MIYNPPWAGPITHPIIGSGKKFSRGEYISEIDPSTSYELQVDNKAPSPLEFPPLDYFVSSDSTTFFSEEMKCCLNEMGVRNVQYFNINVTYQPTGENVNCFGANVLGMLRTVDVNKSDCTLYKGTMLRNIKKIVFDEKNFRDELIFRCFEFRSLLVVRKDIKDKFIEKKFTGMLLVLPEDWDESMQ